MMNFRGYFLEASKFGGLTRKPCTLSPFAPGNQKDSRGDMVTWERTASFIRVRRLAPPHICSGSLASFGIQQSVEMASRLAAGVAAATLVTRISIGRDSNMCVDRSSLPSDLTTRSPLYPPRDGWAPMYGMPSGLEMSSLLTGLVPVCSPEK